MDVPCYLFMVSCVSSDHWFVVPTAQCDKNAQSPGENLFHITGYVFVTVAPCNLIWKVEAMWGISFRSRSSAVLLAPIFLYICVCVLCALHPMYIHRDPMPCMVFDWDLSSGHI